MWCGPALEPCAQVAVTVSARRAPRRRARKVKITPEAITSESSFADVREAVRQYDGSHADCDEETWWNDLPKELFFALIRYREEIEAEVAAHDAGMKARSK